MKVLNTQTNAKVTFRLFNLISGSALFAILFVAVCKILATELEERLEETGKTHDVIETGYALDDVKPKKKKEYKKSELRLVESLDGVCDRILQYNIHKERTDSTRFAKGMSQTFQALHGLVDKGVKVELGIPYELWDKPSAEITNMKTQVIFKFDFIRVSANTNHSVAILRNGCLVERDW